MSDLIDKKVLYNHFVDLEAVALEQVKKHMHDDDLTEWRIWSTILAERTAYKHDVFDAHVVDAESVRHRYWIKAKYPLFTCSECGATYQDDGYGYYFCPNCGAKMDEVTEDDADA